MITMTQRTKECRMLSERKMTHPNETGGMSPSENGIIQIHADGEILQGEKITDERRRSDRNTNKPYKYGSMPYTKTFWIGLINKDCYRTISRRDKKNS